MPHAEETAAPTINGDVPTSEFFSHLNSHPVIHESVNLFKSNKYGSLTLVYADKSYATFVTPLLPYTKGPYSYISPYVERADHLAAQGLDKVDSTFPIVTKDTQTLKNDTMEIVTFPIKKAGETRDHVLGAWSQEYKKCGGDGVVAGSKALITTSLLLTTETLGWLSAWLSKGKEKSAVTVKEVKDKASN